MTARKLQIRTGLATREFVTFVNEFIRYPRRGDDNVSPGLALDDGREVHLEIHVVAQVQGGGTLISGWLLRKLSTTDRSRRFMKEQQFTLMMDGNTAEAAFALMS